MRAIYENLEIAFLDEQTGTEKGFDNRVASLLANLSKIQNSNAPDASGSMKEGIDTSTSDVDTCDQLLSGARARIPMREVLFPTPPCPPGVLYQPAGTIGLPLDAPVCSDSRRSGTPTQLLRVVLAALFEQAVKAQFPEAVPLESATLLYMEIHTITPAVRLILAYIRKSLSLGILREIRADKCSSSSGAHAGPA